MVTTAIFPSRYVQGKGALTTHLPQELAALGHKALILQDPVVHNTYRDTVATALHGVIEFDIEVFSSECSDEEIARISARAQEIGADVIVGMGGGKTLDTAKATGASLRLPAAAYCRGSYSGLNGCAVQFTGCYLYARREIQTLPDDST